jgi:hypothetical protein
MSNNDIRSRLADALQRISLALAAAVIVRVLVKRPLYANAVMMSVDEHRSHVADILLSLPGIVMDATDIEKAAEAAWWANEGDRWSKSWAQVELNVKDNYRRMARAALLAAANAVESYLDPDCPSCQCGGQLCSEHGTGKLQEYGK